jgi:hypothetical protein
MVGGVSALDDGGVRVRPRVAKSREDAIVFVMSLRLIDGLTLRGTCCCCTAV